MALNPFVRALSLVGFDAFASGQGLNPADMLRRASLPQDSLRRQDGILSYRRYCELLELCAAQSGNASFGLQYGLFQGIDVFGELFYLIRNAGTVGDALAELRANYSLYNGGAEVGFGLEGGIARLGYRVNESDIPGLRQAEELACSVGVQLLRALAGAGWRPATVRLRHQPLGDEATYRRVLGVRPVFAAPCTELEFDASVLALPLGAADARLHQLITEHIARMERLPADELPSYVRQLLRNLLPSGRATLEKVADCMAVNPRTLQRRLGQEGTSFQRLLDETRQGMARHYLDDPSISMAQLAGLLGYSDASGFSRAFNRWFNVSPLKWQKRQSSNRQPRLLRSRLPNLPG
ncbi:AraC family transcriptional regulator [Pseudomonas sp. BN417]|uniref:AraC family transcriptional regulator n=1 Tax=Pseudomonas sp. BN417 TaxID=2567890 RepID=UPI002454EEC9|nr:AraC family transcriptional regulator [Pseudomonas sp. BN417]MDH4556193.1 AraC family transcriptional regulator [Pseudomonas sp. BN417]